MKKIFLFVLILVGAFTVYTVWLSIDKQENANRVEIESSLPVGASTTSIANTLDNKTVASSTTITVTGTFVGLKEGIDRLDRVFTYLLLNDGSNMLRIDLRPLIGYSDINIIEKLGVERGNRITVNGVINDEGFQVERIE